MTRRVLTGALRATGVAVTPTKTLASLSQVTSAAMTTMTGALVVILSMAKVVEMDRPTVVTTAETIRMLLVLRSTVRF